MGVSTVRYEADVEIARPVWEVFERLADLGSYPVWMHRRGLFRGCRPTTDGPVGLGTAYTDSTWMGTFVGEVSEYDAPHRLAFSETLSWFGRPMSTARPSYVLEGDDTRTTVHHVALGDLHGPMRLMKPGAAWMAKGERERTLRSLQRSLEQPTP